LAALGHLQRGGAEWKRAGESKLLSADSLKAFAVE
jgi:hypothetical protein